MTRSQSGRAVFGGPGAGPAVAAALDPGQVAGAVARAGPGVIVGQLTAIGPAGPRHVDRDFAPASRLRAEGAGRLSSAGQAVGVRRLVAQSHGASCCARAGGAVKGEEDPLGPAPARGMGALVAAIAQLGEAVPGAGWAAGIVPRYGASCGPGAWPAPGEEQLELVRERKFPPAGGGGVWSFTHTAGAAEAAVEHGGPGADTIVGDGPAPAAEWLPAPAIPGAKESGRAPRLAPAGAGAVLMTELRGACCASAGREPGWAPAHPGWRRELVT